MNNHHLTLLLLSQKTSERYQWVITISQDLTGRHLLVITISQDLRGRLIHCHFHKIWDVTSTSHGQFIRPQRETIINNHHLTRSIRKILRELRERHKSSNFISQDLRARHQWVITILQNLRERHQWVISKDLRGRRKWIITIKQDLRRRHQRVISQDIRRHQWVISQDIRRHQWAKTSYKIYKWDINKSSPSFRNLWETSMNHILKRGIITF